MTIVTLYLVSAVMFLLVDIIGLRFVIKPVFERNVGHLFADPFRMVPAAVFYFGYVAGVLWFVSIPALATGTPLAAMGNGFVLGVLTYGTYEFTNMATLRDWTREQVVYDTIWGGVLTAVVAGAGVALTPMIIG